MFFILIAHILLSVSHAEIPKIDVLLQRSLKEVLVSGTDLIKHMGSAEAYSGPKSFKFNCASTLAGTPSKPNLVAKLSSQTGLISFEKQKYQGELVLLASQGRGCDVVNSIPLETYLSTLLSKEMNKAWPLEVLKAQAVAARTYAYHKMRTQEVSKASGYNTYYHIESSEKHQVSGTFFDQSRLTVQATQETEGEILVTNNTHHLTPIFFHSKCGGKTFRPDQVWGNKVEGYQNVECPFCRKYGTKPWVHRMNSLTFKDTLDLTLKRYYKDKLKRPFQILRMVPDHEDKTELRFYEEDQMKLLSKPHIRSAIGRNKLPSNNFSIEKVDNQVIFKGHGLGHGVGMCQFGALELAKRGYTYKQILSFYFPGHQLSKAYQK